jgi:hypothetical protein
LKSRVSEPFCARANAEGRWERAAGHSFLELVGGAPGQSRCDTCDRYCTALYINLNGGKFDAVVPAWRIGNIELHTESGTDFVHGNTCRILSK